MLSSSSPVQATKTSALADAFLFQNRPAGRIAMHHDGLLQMAGQKIAPLAIAFDENHAVVPPLEHVGQMVARLPASGDHDPLLDLSLGAEKFLHVIDFGR